MNQKQKTNANNHPQQEPTQSLQIKNTNDSVSNLARFVSLLSILTTLLIAIGYFYSSGVADTFHLDVSEIANSATEFVMMAPYALGLVFTKLAEKLPHFINDLFDNVIWTCLGLAILFPLVWYVVRRQKQQKPRAKTPSQLKAAPWYSKAGVQYSMAALLGAGVAPITLVVIYGAILYMLALVFAFMLPLGYLPGKANAETYIINPDRCEPLPVVHAKTPTPKTSAKPDKPKKEVLATCVAVVKNGNEIARGRRIAVHAERIFLFVKKTGEVKSIPLNDASVELVDTDEAPAR